jgi:outer membrane protein OmpA-like peptidoglycan-associated protein
VVGHAEEKAGGDPVQQQVASLDLALDRANAVAQALVVLGVPANAIAVEAAPTHGGSELPRAEVFMEY